MQYTCRLIIETLREPTLGAMHLAHTESVIEKCRRTQTALWVVSFSLFLPSPQRVIQSALHLVLMSRGSRFGEPHPHLPPLSFPNIAAFQPPVNPPRCGPLDPASLMSQQDIPGVSALSLIVLTLPSPTSSSTVRQPPHTHVPIHTTTYSTQTNTFELHWFKMGKKR